jgi:hypothetical protein
MSSNLSTYSPKFASKLTSYDALTHLPLPVALGSNHKPVPHATLIDAIRKEIAIRGWAVQREQYAVGKKGAALFGVIDLQPTVPIISAHETRGISLGLRNSTNESIAITVISGERVFVCDNLVMSGDLIAISRKNTTNLDLHDAIAKGFDKFLIHIVALDVELVRLQETPITDPAAKVMIFDVFAAGIVPVRLFDDVERFYFHPSEDMTDCTPRTAWAAMNAFTRALKDLPPVSLISTSVALGKHFGLKSNE